MFLKELKKLERLQQDFAISGQKKDIQSNILVLLFKAKTSLTYQRKRERK